MGTLRVTETVLSLRKAERENFSQVWSGSGERPIRVQWCRKEGSSQRADAKRAKWGWDFLTPKEKMAPAYMVMPSTARVFEGQAGLEQGKTCWPCPGPIGSHVEPNLRARPLGV